MALVPAPTLHWFSLAPQGLERFQVLQRVSVSDKEDNEAAHSKDETLDGTYHQPLGSWEALTIGQQSSTL